MHWQPSHAGDSGDPGCWQKLSWTDPKMFSVGLSTPVFTPVMISILGTSSGQLGCSLGRACDRRNLTTAALSQMSCFTVNRCRCLSSFLIPQEGGGYQECSPSPKPSPNPSCPVLAGCRSDRYGPGCSLRCQCAGRSRCNPHNGSCTCPNSWMGPNCREGNQPFLVGENTHVWPMLVVGLDGSVNPFWIIG